MQTSILREITPLSERDCFMIFSRIKYEFTYPLHIHTEYELNFIENGKGAKRIVGDSIEPIDDLELTLIANPSLEHGWLGSNSDFTEIKEITIQFHGDLFAKQLLEKNQFKTIKEMFEHAINGITFSRETILKVKNKLYSLAYENDGAYSVLNFWGILYELSLSTQIRELSSQSFVKKAPNHNSRRLEKIYNYLKANYQKEIKLKEIADMIGMTEVALSRFFKKRTGRNFIDSLNDIRLGHACRLLLDTTHNIVEICSLSGFNNVSNFNRIFKKKKNCTPSEFRDSYKGGKMYL